MAENGASGDTEINSQERESLVQGSDETGEGDQALMLIVGSEGLAAKVLTILESINETGSIKMKTTQQLKPENAGRWKDEDVAYIVFIIDASDPLALKAADDQLSYMDRNYVFAFDRINFLLALESEEGKTMILKASDVAAFMAKFGQPLMNIVFNEGWQADELLKEQMRMFINRFQILAGKSPDPDSSSNSSQSQSQ